QHDEETGAEADEHTRADAGRLAAHLTLEADDRAAEECGRNAHPECTLNRIECRHRNLHARVHWLPWLRTINDMRATARNKGHWISSIERGQSSLRGRARRRSASTRPPVWQRAQ